MPVLCAALARSEVILPVSTAAADRWALHDPHGVVWDIENDTRLPHQDHIEMSGRLVSVIVTYGVSADGGLVLSRRVVWPTLRTIPNDTHASLIRDYGLDWSPHISVDGARLAPEHPVRVSFDGALHITSRTAEGIEVTRSLFPSVGEPAVMEILAFVNRSRDPLHIRVAPLLGGERVHGAHGSYDLEVTCRGCSEELATGGECRAYLTFAARETGKPATALEPSREGARRYAFARGLMDSLVLDTPDPVINRAFGLAKLRAAESVFSTRGGLMHCPGGSRYYAAVWANDQAEYAGPFFPFLGDPGANEATLNCYRLFARHMGPDYAPIPSSIIAEGADTWRGAGDRGDAAMIAYGAARFALALGDREAAEELWPTIEWCLEYCRRRTTPEGVIASDSDELEGRFPAGNANLSTAMLTYGGLVSGADLARELGRADAAHEYSVRALSLRDSAEAYFGAEVEGFRTYRYYAGNTVLRAWICLPLTMGIMDRAPGTVAALFSPRLWTEDGLATEAGSPVFWDRSTLYALRGVFAAGETDLALRHLSGYTRRRLLGDHVPYAVEAYPEGNQAHLSAESALFCRVITEGLFGIRPTGFRSFECAPRLPSTWESMSLRHIRAFGSDFSIAADRRGTRTHVTVSGADAGMFEAEWDGGAPLSVGLS